jgi:hypothetical protein
MGQNKAGRTVCFRKSSPKGFGFLERLGDDRNPMGLSARGKKYLDGSFASDRPMT